MKKEIINIFIEGGFLEVKYDFENLKNKEQLLMKLEVLKLILLGDYIKEYDKIK